jgi:hypothetical protein
LKESSWAGLLAAKMAASLGSTMAGPTADLKAQA